MTDKTDIAAYLKTLTLLYVEDERDAREQFTLFLKRIVGKLVTAKDGLEGVAVFCSENPDVVVTDIRMPNMNGLEMSHEIRKMNQDVPIIILTAYEQVDYLKESINLHVDKYVTKPVDGFTLQQTLLECAKHLLNDAALHSAACSDPLTGLANRRELINRFNIEKSASERHGTPLSIIIADIDHFKSVNDTYGHLAGDAVLKEVAGVIKSSLRREDTSGRWGGEEFLLILPDTGLEAAGAAAEKLRVAVAALRTRWEKQEIAVTISMGVARLTHGMEMEECTRLADSALYRAKAGGRNRVEAASAPTHPAPSQPPV